MRLIIPYHFLINESSASLKYMFDLNHAAMFKYGSQGILDWMVYSIHIEDMFWPFIISVKSGVMNEAWFLSGIWLLIWQEPAFDTLWCLYFFITSIIF